MRKIIWHVYASLFTFCLFCAEPPTLADITPCMEEIFHYHVQTKEMNPTILRRSLRNYVSQFDPQKNYLLEQEVNEFFNLSDDAVLAAVEEFKEGKVKIYERLHKVLVGAILRNRDLRVRLGKEIQHLSLVKTENEGFASSEEELYQKLQIQFFQLYHSAQKIEPHVTKERIFQFFEKKKLSIEEQYLSFSPHIREGEYVVAKLILKSICKALDAHTTFFSYDEAFEMRARLKKEFPGIGVVIREDFRGAFIGEIVPGSPASQSGAIQKGDQVLSVDGVRPEDDGCQTISKKLLGEEGSTCTLELKRGDRVFSVSVKRELITLADERIKYETRMTPQGLIGYIYIPSFYDNGGSVNAASDTKAAIIEMKKQGELKGIILDLRTNLGGFLSQAVKLTGIFIANGVVVVSRYGDGEVKYARDLDARSIFQGPMIVLTSKMSASAAEIVSQALQDYGAAIIVGDERTYGKGSMQYQTVIDGGASYLYKVTVGRYYTASGRSPQLEGVYADIIAPTQFAQARIGEKYLQFPLQAEPLHPAALDVLGVMRGGEFTLQLHHHTPQVRLRPSRWRSMLPSLQKLSEERIRKNRGYQLFIEKSPKSQPLDYSKEEGVAVLLDMITLSDSCAHQKGN